VGQGEGVKGKSGNEEKLSDEEKAGNEKNARCEENARREEKLNTEEKVWNEKNTRSEEGAWSEDKLAHLCLPHGIIGFHGVLRTLWALERGERVVVEAFGFGNNRPTVAAQLQRSE
jgi:hypothetical protein